jgi:putative ABC transport system permease protein
LTGGVPNAYSTPSPMQLALTHALRSLRRSPGFVALATVTLGLGLALTTTMFALLDSVTRPYTPYLHAERLFSVLTRYDRRVVPVGEAELYRHLRDGIRSFDATMPMSGRTMTVEVSGEAERALVAQVPARFLATLGLVPAVGRDFSPADEEADVALVSREYWKHFLHGRGSLEGVTLALDSRIYNVIGVMPYGMALPTGAAVWTLMPGSVEQTGAGTQFIRPLVRLRQDVDSLAAKAELLALGRKLRVLYPEARFDFTFKLVSVHNTASGFYGLHGAMVGAAVFVLLIACANLANLMLARASSRRRDLALRLAVGATRRAVVAELFMEAVLIAVGGGFIGILLSIWAAHLLTWGVPREVALLGILEPQMSWRVFAASTLATSVSALVFGLLPALRIVSGVRLDEALKDASGNSTSRLCHRYNGLVIGEAALALVLVMNAGVLTREVRGYAGIRYNFAAKTLLRAYVAAPVSDSVRTTTTSLARTGLLSRLRALPGVVGTASEAFRSPHGPLITAESGSDSTRTALTYGYSEVSASFFQTMGLAIREGRDFLDGDGNGSRRAAIVNRTVSRQLYPHGGAVGHMVKLGIPASDAPWVLIIGVADDAVGVGESRPRVYVMEGATQDRGFMLLVRAAREDPRVTGAVRREIQASGWSMDDGMVEPFLAGEALATHVLGFLVGVFATMASLALLLAGAGLYAVLTYAVSRRMREFGVRVALGAARADMIRLIGYDAAVMLLAGTAIGGLASLGATMMIGPLLKNVPPTDVWSLVAAEAVLLAAGVVACAAPVHRASRADPLEIMRAV